MKTNDLFIGHFSTYKKMLPFARATLLVKIRKHENKNKLSSG
jgi:hypothetical protein